MRFYPTNARVDGYILFEDREFPDVAPKEKFPVITHIGKKKESEHYTLRIPIPVPGEYPEIIFNLETNQLDSPDDDYFIAEYCNILLIKRNQYVIVCSFIRANLGGNIIKQFLFVGNACSLRPGIEYLTLS